MRNRRTSPVQPRLFIGIPGSHKGRCSDLLRVQSETDFAGVILALWNGAGDRL